MFHSNLNLWAGLCSGFAMSVLGAQAQSEAVTPAPPAASTELTTLKVLAVGDPPVTILETTGKGEGGVALVKEKEANPAQVPPRQLLLKLPQEKEKPQEVVVSLNQLSSSASLLATGSAALMVPGASEPLVTLKSPDAKPTAFLCVLRPANNSSGWTKPSATLLMNDWVQFPAGSMRVLNMSSFAALVQSNDKKWIIPAGQIKPLDHGPKDSESFTVYINTPNGVQSLRQSTLSLAPGQRSMLVLYDRIYDKRKKLASVLQLDESKP